MAVTGDNLHFDEEVMTKADNETCRAMIWQLDGTYVPCTEPAAPERIICRPHAAVEASVRELNPSAG